MAERPTDPTTVVEKYRILGREVTLPCRVRDARSASVVYAVDAATAQRLVGPAYEIVEMGPGLTQLVLGFVDYRDNDLGDYDEVMVVFMVRPRQAESGQEGTYIYRLPVNQSFTCEAGRHIWGFPKTVESIEIQETPQRATCRLAIDGVPAFTLSVPRGAADAGEGPLLSMTTYSYVRDVPVAIRFTSGGRGVTVTGGEEVELELGRHPLADQLRSLGLPTAPLLCTWTEHMYGSFGAPEPLGPTSLATDDLA